MWVHVEDHCVKRCSLSYVSSGDFVVDVRKEQGMWIKCWANLEEKKATEALPVVKQAFGKESMSRVHECLNVRID